MLRYAVCLFMLLKAAQLVYIRNYLDILMRFLVNNGVCVIHKEVWIDSGDRTLYMICGSCHDNLEDPKCLT